MNMQLFHDAWGYAHDHPEECTDGYDKRAFMHVQFWLEKVKATQQPKPEIRDYDLREFWRAHGGEFHGPHTETAYVVETKLYPLLRSMIAHFRDKLR